MSWSEYISEIRETLLINKYVQQARGSMLSAIPAPSEREMRQFLSRNQQRFINPEMIRFDQVFIDTRNADSASVSSARERLEQESSRIRSGRIECDDLLDSSVDDASLQGGDVSVGRALDEQAGRQPLEDGTDFVDLPRTVLVEGRHLRSGVRYHRHQPLGLELAERFPD
jgi:hypothetical protein